MKGGILLRATAATKHTNALSQAGKGLCMRVLRTVEGLQLLFKHPTTGKAAMSGGVAIPTFTHTRMVRALAAVTTHIVQYEHGAGASTSRGDGKGGSKKKAHHDAGSRENHTSAFVKVLPGVVEALAKPYYASSSRSKPSKGVSEGMSRLHLDTAKVASLHAVFVNFIPQAIHDVVFTFDAFCGVLCFACRWWCCK